MTSIVRLGGVAASVPGYALRLFLLLLTIASIAPRARADVITLNQTFSGPAENPAGTPYGSITIFQYNNNPDQIEITEALSSNANFKFHQNNTTHVMLAFNLPSLTLTGFTANSTTFTPGQITLLTSPAQSGLSFVTSISPAGYPSFGYGISCNTSCGTGFSTAFAGPLQLVITSSTALSPAAFEVPSVSGGVNYYAASDLIDNTGKTGNVGGTTLTVPEPRGMAAVWIALMMLMIGRARPRSSSRSQCA